MRVVDLFSSVSNFSPRSSVAWVGRNVRGNEIEELKIIKNLNAIEGFSERRSAAITT